MSCNLSLRTSGLSGEGIETRLSYRNRVLRGYIYSFTKRLHHLARGGDLPWGFTESQNNYLIISYRAFYPNLLLALIIRLAP